MSKVQIANICASVAKDITLEYDVMGVAVAHPVFSAAYTKRIAANPSCTF